MSYERLGAKRRRLANRNDSSRVVQELLEEEEALGTQQLEGVPEVGVEDIPIEDVVDDQGEVIDEREDDDIVETRNLEPGRTFAKEDREPAEEVNSAGTIFEIVPVAEGSVVPTDNGDNPEYEVSDDEFERGITTGIVAIRTDAPLPPLAWDDMGFSREDAPTDGMLAILPPPEDDAAMQSLALPLSNLLDVTGSEDIRQLQVSDDLETFSKHMDQLLVDGVLEVKEEEIDLTGIPSLNSGSGEEDIRAYFAVLQSIQVRLEAELTICLRLVSVDKLDALLLEDAWNVVNKIVQDMTAVHYKFKDGIELCRSKGLSDMDSHWSAYVRDRIQGLASRLRSAKRRAARIGNSSDNGDRRASIKQGAVYEDEAAVGSSRESTEIVSVQDEERMAEAESRVESGIRINDALYEQMMTQKLIFV